MFGNVEITTIVVVVIGVEFAEAMQTRQAWALWLVFVAGAALEWMSQHLFPHPGVRSSSGAAGATFYANWSRQLTGIPAGAIFCTTRSGYLTGIPAGMRSERFLLQRRS
jgi:hypothetical protein